MERSVWIYILVMAGVSYLLRVLPITLIRKQIKSHFIKSVLYYLPYVTLSVMTVPAILTVSENPASGAVALVAAFITAWTTSNLFFSATIACAAVCITELFIGMFH